MSSEYVSFRVTEKDVNVHKRFPVPYADVAVEAQDFHPSGEFKGIILLCVLVVVSHDSVYRRADCLNASETNIFLLNYFCKAVKQIRAVWKLPHVCSFYLITCHRSEANSQFKSND